MKRIKHKITLGIIFACIFGGTALSYLAFGAADTAFTLATLCFIMFIIREL